MQWRQCGDAFCILPRCRYEEPSSTLRDRSENRDGSRVSAIWASFCREVCNCIFPEEEPGTVPGPKHLRVRSFATSPQVRVAFLQLRDSCVAHKLEPSDETMREALASLLPELQRHSVAVRDAKHGPPIHRYLGSNAGGEDEARSLRDICMLFLLRVAMWRRSQHGQFRDWTFGEGGEPAEFLATLLLQLWGDERRGMLRNGAGHQWTAVARAVG